MIRNLLPGDIEALVELEATGFQEEASWSKQVWSGELNARDRYGFVWLDSDTRVMGFGFFQTTAEVCELHRIVVARQYRGTGVGSALLEAGIAEAKKRGANRMLLEVREENDPALSLYDRFKFRQIATRENYYRRGANAIVMELDLGEEVSAATQKFSSEPKLARNIDQEAQKSYE